MLQEGSDRDKEGTKAFRKQALPVIIEGGEKPKKSERLCCSSERKTRKGESSKKYVEN
jgi:hypothetical protein